MSRLFTCRAIFLVGAAGLVGCGDDTTSSGSSGGPKCDLAAATFEVGDPDGHPDPFGAKAAGQARAGRILAADVKQPAHGRQQIADGDFALVNDKVAVVIEDKGPSDGYNRFGGEIIAADEIGDDGRMKGLSTFVETMPGFSIYVVDPTDVSVMNDGSDGNAAVIRVSGPLHAIPFLAESFGGLFSDTYANLQGAYEYVLEPGAEKVKFRLGLINSTDVDIDSGINIEGSEEYIGFFQANHNRLVTPEHGYAKQGGTAAFAGFDGGNIGYAYQASPGEQLEFGSIDIGGFQLFVGQGFVVKACSRELSDRHEIVIGGPQYDGLRENRASCQWRACLARRRRRLERRQWSAGVWSIRAHDRRDRRLPEPHGHPPSMAATRSTPPTATSSSFPRSAGIRRTRGRPSLPARRRSNSRSHRPAAFTSSPRNRPPTKECPCGFRSFPTWHRPPHRRRSASSTRPMVASIRSSR